MEEQMELFRDRSHSLEEPEMKKGIYKEMEPSWDLSSREYDGKEVNIITFKDGKELSMPQIEYMFEKNKSAAEPIPSKATSKEILNFLNEKNPTREEFINYFSGKRLNKGGTPILEEQMKLFEEGGLRDEGGMVDEVSGNDVPVGSTRKEVRDDIPAMLSEGEFVFPADVVRYIGLENLMRMRQDAKQGLKQMEAMGQMGNGDEATLPDDMPFGMMDLIIVEGKEEEEEDKPKEMAQGGVIKAQEGTFVIPKFDPRNQDVRDYTNEAGEIRKIPFLGGKPLYPIPVGFYPVGTDIPTEDEAAEVASVDRGDDDRTPPPEPSEFQKAGSWDMDTSATDGKALDMWIKEAQKVSTFGNVAAGIGGAINPLFGGLIALSNKQQKKKIVSMLDEKIAQARKTPIKGQLEALEKIKTRLTTDEGKGILSKVISEITDTVTDALGLSEEEKKTAKVTSTVNTQQSPDEPDDKTEKDATNAVEQPDETATTLIDNGILGPEDFAPKPPEAPESGEQLEVGPAIPVAPVAPETPEAIPTAPELPVDIVPSTLPETPESISVPTDSTFTPPEEGAMPDTLPLRTEQAVVGAGMTVLQDALKELRAAQPYRGPVSGMTIEEKLEDPMAPFKKGWEKLTDAISQVSTTDYTPPTQPTPTTVSTGGGDDDDGPSFADEMQKAMQEKATESLDKFDENVEKVKAAAGSDSDQQAIEKEAAAVKEKLEQQEKGIKTGFKKGGLASRKK